MSEYLYPAPHTAYWENEDDLLEFSSIYVANLKTSEIFEFTNSASIIWGLITEKMTEQDIIQEIAQIYEEKEEVVAEGTKAFILDLLTNNLVTLS